MRTAVSILLLSLVVVCVLFVREKKSNHRLAQSLSRSMARIDSLKMNLENLDKQSARLKNHTDSLEIDNRTIKTALTKAKADLTVEDLRIADYTKSFEDMKKKCDGFLVLQKQWSKEQGDLLLTNTKLKEENKNLTDKIATLSQKNQQMNLELSFAKLLEKDNISIVRLDKYDKPSLSAKKIRKIKVAMSLPSEIKSAEFKIFDSNGKMLPNQSGSFTSHFLRETNVFGKEAARLELTYSLTQRVNSGSYRLEIVDEGKHVGNLFMNLR